MADLEVKSTPVVSAGLDKTGLDHSSSYSEATVEVSLGHEVSADGEEPTEEEKKRLRHVPENLPLSAWFVAVVELCERFTYYGCQGIFQNYVQRPLDGSLGRGALGMGQTGATALTTFFSFWCYVTPIIGAIAADQYLGKYRAIKYFCVVYIAGLFVLLFTSLPISLHHGAGLGGFIGAILLLGLGTGGIKSNVSPLIADQYERRTMAMKTLPSGERIILDPAVTIQRIYMIFYFCINLGSLSVLATPYMELYVGFWSAYLLCTCVFFVGFIVLLVGEKHYIVKPPQGSIITHAFRAMWIMVTRRSMDAPRPSYLAEHGGNYKAPWSDQFIEELKCALVACKVFCFYPIYWVCYGQFSNNFVSQAGEMRGHGMPNDLMQNFDPISIIVFVPILDQCVYPLLQRLHIPFKPITRIALGFIVASLAMLYAAVLQYKIYQTGPCYDAPAACAAAYDSEGVAQGNNIHIALQIPAYMLIGISEIFASVTGLEYAYMKAPASMKSFVTAMYLLTNAFGSAISEALVSEAVDPNVQWLYVGLCAATFVAGIVFYVIYHKLNNTEDAMNALVQSGEMATMESEAEVVKKM